MNVLANAKHRAGIRSVSTMPILMMIITAILLSVLLYLKRSDWSSLLVLVSILAVLVSGPVIAYFFARRNPELLREELREIIRSKESNLSMYQYILEEISRQIDFEKNWRAKEEKLWTENAPRAKEVAMRGVKRAIRIMRGIDREVDNAFKIRNQEVSLRFHRTLRQYEETLEELKISKDGAVPEKWLQRLEAGSEKLCEILEVHRMFWQEKNTESRRIISEAQKLLQELQ